MPKPRAPQLPKPLERRRRRKGPERRERARPISPQEMIKETAIAERETRALMREFHTLREQMGIKNTKDANLRRLKRRWKAEGQKRKLGLLNRLIKLRQRYTKSLRNTAWLRRLRRLRLLRDPKFVQIENLAAFTHRTFQLIRSAETAKKPYSMTIIDIDLFKQINDRYGHGVGDVVINEMANLLNLFAEMHRGAAARVGGEEFRVFVAMSKGELARELRGFQKAFSGILSKPQSFAVSPIKSWRGWTAPTFSAGISGRRGRGRSGELNEVISALATESDAALYRAKEKRNAIRIHR